MKKWKISPFLATKKEIEEEVSFSGTEILMWYLILLGFCLFVGVFVNVS